MTRTLFLAVPLLAVAGLAALPAADPPTPAEAFASYEMVTNGFADQKAFDAAFAQFSEDANAVGTGDAEGGLGPTFNGTSCVACHPGGNGSAQRELRAGHFDGAAFSAPPGGSLVRLLATDPQCQQRPLPGFDDVIAERVTTDLRGRGYMEFVRDGDILAVRDAQPADVRGFANVVTDTIGVNADGAPITATRIGRFGHKCQIGNLRTFAAVADRDEKGRTSAIVPTKAPDLLGNSLMQFVRSAGLDDADGSDGNAYAKFTRSLPAPPRNHATRNTPDVLEGERFFTQIGCAVCHTPTYTTAPPGAAIAGFASVPAALGGLTFHPYSDMLMHDVGTGDGIVQGGPPETRNQMRTTPLMGLARRTLLMHDGRSATLTDAIRRHGGQAAPTRDRFFGLTDGDRRKALAFLLSL